MTSTRSNPFNDLERDWAAVGGLPAARNALARWSETEPLLRAFKTPLDVVAACHRHEDSVQENALLGALLRQAKDPLATRAVLQAIVPGLAARTWRWIVRYLVGSTHSAVLPWADGTDLATDVLAIAVSRIAVLAGTSPAWPATVLIDGTWSRVRNVVAEHRRWQQRNVPMVEESAVTTCDDPRPVLERLAVALTDAVRRDVLPASRVAVVYSTRVLGYSPDELVGLAGDNPKAVRARRERAERVLAPAC